MPLPLILLLLASAGAAASPRSRTNFDADWRFQLGPARPSGHRLAGCNASTFPVNLSGVQCLGLTQQPSSIGSVEACRTAACTAGAGLWQFYPIGRGGAGGCWLGPDCSSTGPRGAGWVGAGRSAPSQHDGSCAAGLPCDPEFDDSSWRSVTVPHGIRPPCFSASFRSFCARNRGAKSGVGQTSSSRASLTKVAVAAAA